MVSTRQRNEKQKQTLQQEEEKVHFFVVNRRAPRGYCRKFKTNIHIPSVTWRSTVFPVHSIPFSVLNYLSPEFQMLFQGEVETRNQNGV